MQRDAAGGRSSECDGDESGLALGAGERKNTVSQSVAEGPSGIGREGLEDVIGARFLSNEHIGLREMNILLRIGPTCGYS